MSGAVIYARVSTDEQQRRNSANLPTQQKKCREWAISNNLPVLHVFTDQESGRTTERASLQELLKYCRENKGKVTHVVVADLSRLARNVADQASLIAQFTRMGIKLRSVDEPMLDETSAGKLSAGIIGVMNQFYSDNLSERVRYRMAETIKSGRIVWQAPLGYKHYASNGTKGLVIDESMAAHVRNAFELMATGSYTSDAVLRMCTAMGLRTHKGNTLSKQGFSKLIRNPIYAGWVVSKDIKVKGTHEPLISQELFDRAQAVLEGRKSIHVRHRREHEDFPLRGFVKCAACDKPLTAGWAKGRNKTYPRYWCWNKDCPNPVGRGKEELEQNWVRLLGMYQPTAELLAKLPEMAKTQWAARRERISAEKKALTTRLNEQTTLNQRAIEAKLTGQLSDEDFTLMKTTIAERTTTINEQLKTLQSEELTVEQLMDSAKVQVLNLAKSWQNAGVNERHEIQTGLFPDGLRFSRELLFFEPQNTRVIADVRELVNELVNNGRGERI